MCWALLASPDTFSLPPVPTKTHLVLASLNRICFVGDGSGEIRVVRSLRGGCDTREIPDTQGDGKMDVFDKFKKLLSPSRFNMIKTFRSLDREDSGVISKAEFADALQDLGLFASAKEIGQLFDHMDENKDGSISFEVCKNMAINGNPSNMITASSMATCSNHAAPFISK